MPKRYAPSRDWRSTPPARMSPFGMKTAYDKGTRRVRRIATTLGDLIAAIYQLLPPGGFRIQRTAMVLARLPRQAHLSRRIRLVD